MERQLWTWMVGAVRAAGQGHRQRQRRFTDEEIILTFFWAVFNDRPVSWAADPRNWPFYLRIRSRPSSSTMSRRLRSASVSVLLSRLKDVLTTTPAPGIVLIIDAKPLPVGGYTTDRDARAGRACGCFAWGYKLYLVIGEDGSIQAWKVDSMNASEQTVAEELIPAAAQSAGAGRWLLGDKAYDTNRLYALARSHGLRLLAPRLQRGAGIGPGQDPDRYAAAALLEGEGTPVGNALIKRRDAIERFLGTLCCRGGGLGPLPGFVRGLRRVRMWVDAKLLFQALRARHRITLAA